MIRPLTSLTGHDWGLRSRSASSLYMNFFIFRSCVQNLRGSEESDPDLIVSIKMCLEFISSGKHMEYGFKTAFPHFAIFVSNGMIFKSEKQINTIIPFLLIMWRGNSPGLDLNENYHILCMTSICKIMHTPLGIKFFLRLNLAHLDF